MRGKLVNNKPHKSHKLLPKESMIYDQSTKSYCEDQRAAAKAVVLPMDMINYGRGSETGSANYESSLPTSTLAGRDLARGVPDD